MSDFDFSQFGPDKPLPDIERRRSVDPILESLLHKVSGMEDRIARVLDQKIAQLRDEIRDEIRGEIENLVPDGDVAGHRRAHEAMIRNASRWDGFKFALLEHISKTIAIAAIVYVAMSVFEQFRRSL